MLPVTPTDSFECTAEDSNPELSLRADDRNRTCIHPLSGQRGTRTLTHEFLRFAALPLAHLDMAMTMGLEPTYDLVDNQALFQLSYATMLPGAP